MLENAYSVMGIVVGVSLVVAAFIYLLLPKILERLLNIKQWLAALEDIVDTVYELLGTVDPEGDDYVDLRSLLDLVKQAVYMAEQLYLTNELPKEERKAFAVQFVVDALQLMGIEVDEEMILFIGKAIEAAVFAMNLLIKQGVNPSLV